MSMTRERREELRTRALDECDPSLYELIEYARACEIETGRALATAKEAIDGQRHSCYGLICTALARHDALSELLRQVQAHLDALESGHEYVEPPQQELAL